MKRTAALVLNRNLPRLADELAEWIMETNGEAVDMYVVENGSDIDKYSKYANIAFTQSYGPARGTNEALLQLFDKGYDYFWINFNDVRYTKPDFLDHALSLFKTHQEIGVVTGYWPGNIRRMGKIQNLEMLSFFDPLGFIVSRKALEVCQNHPTLNLHPLWDSSNFANHFNILGTALALYSAGLMMVADPNQEIYELSDAADVKSEQARGFDEQTWKHSVGPGNTAAWLSRQFPEKKGDIKMIREAVIRDIVSLAGAQFPHYVDIANRGGIYRFINNLVKTYG